MKPGLSFLSLSLQLGVLLLAGGLPLRSSAYPGGNDSSFHLPGAINGPIYAVAVDAAANIWIGGRFTQIAGLPFPGLALLHPDGTLNTNDFNPSVLTPGLGEVHALTVDGFLNVYVGAKYGINRLMYRGPANAWGLDASFSAYASEHINQVVSLAIQTSSGNITALYAAGRAYYTNVNGVVIRNIIKLKSYGAFDNEFDLPAGLAYQGVSQIRLITPGIGPTNTGSTDHLIIAGGSGFTGKLSTMGTNPELYFDPSGYASCVAERPNTLVGCTDSGGHGDLFAGGNFGPAFDYNVNDYGTDLWLNRFGGYPAYYHAMSHNNYPTDQGPFISAIEALPTGDLLVAGVFNRLGGVNLYNLAHVLPNGQVNPAFPSTLGFTPTAMAQQPDGKFIIVGKSDYSPVGGQITRRLAMDEPRGVTFTTQPADGTIYEGDSYCFQAVVDSWPPHPLVWVRNGTALTNQTSPSMCVVNATSADAGDYHLSAELYCSSGYAQSATAHLTVLPAPARPPNDMFSNAISLAGFPVTATGTLRNSTLQAGEPNHAGNANGHSVWWRWVAPSSGLVVIDVSGCDFPAALGVYTGSSVGALTKVMDNCDLVPDGEGGFYCGGVLPSISVPVIAGATYNIAIGGAIGSSSLGNIFMRLGSRLTPWAQSASGTSDSLYGVAAGNGHIVAGGYPAAILTSMTGTQWAQMNAGIDPGFGVNGVGYGNGAFLAAADSGTLAISRDGTNWASQPTGLTADNTLFSATYGNGLYAAVGWPGTVITSPNGSNWTLRASGIGTTANDSLYFVTYANGLFVAVGFHATLVTSPDGTNWTLRVSGVSTTRGLNGVAYGNGRFVVVGDQGVIVTSVNGINWSTATSGVTAYLYSVAFGNGRFVAVGDTGTILISTDGINWVKDVSGISTDLYGVSYYQNSQFVIVGDVGVILMNRFPQLGAPLLLANGQIQFGLIGLSGSTAIIEATSTLAPPNWQPIATNTIVDGLATFTTSRTNFPNRYYRGRVQ
jgi:hypothetical protein